MKLFVPLQIVRAGLSDIKVLTPLFEKWREFYKEAANAGEAASFLSARLRNRECVIFLARNHENPALGYVLIYPTFSSLQMSRIIVLNDMFVLEKARRCGIGRALLDAARIYAQSIGATRIDVSLKRDNAPGLSLYTSLGYRVDDFNYLSLPIT